MTEKGEHWVDLTKEQRDQVLAGIGENPSLLAQLTNAAQSGDVLAAEALLAYNSTVVIEDMSNPNSTSVFKKEE